MNWRLLTDEERRGNRIARQQRKDQHKAIRRRQIALEAVRDPLLLLDEAALPGCDVCEIIWRKDLRPLKRAISELADLTVAIDYPEGNKCRLRLPKSAAPRPSRLLRAAKRGTVPPRFLPPQPEFESYLGADNAIEVVAQRLRDGADAASMLQFLSAPEATGLGVRACASMVQRLGLMTRVVADSAAELVESVEAFQAGVADGQALFEAIVLSGTVEAAQGDWLSFSRPALLRLLPGLQIPNEFRHQHFLANLIVDPEGWPECLDVHARTFLGLFRHPLR